MKHICKFCPFIYIILYYILFLKKLSTLYNYININIPK
jgi:hypothetical protein